jgi:beta-ribofuranosylaminobenzene 5'-phosphate synthase
MSELVAGGVGVCGHPTVVTVETGARLHFGLLGVGASTGRRHGGLGLMIEQPGVRLRVVSSRETQFDCSEALRGRLAEWTARMVAVAGERVTTPVRVTVEAELPAHHGYGSGTQTALALATALATCWCWPERSVEMLARCLGRGGRSTIGMKGFVTGGLIVDAGRELVSGGDELERTSPLVARLELPSEWRVLVVEPVGGEGVSGADERRAFGQIGAMEQATTDRLCRLILLELLPAVTEGEAELFARALGEYGALVGGYFAPAQGGVFGHRLVAEADGWLKRARGIGLAQTSWGPVAATVVASADEANDWAGRLRSEFASGGLTVRVTAPRNVGASCASE